MIDVSANTSKQVHCLNVEKMTILGGGKHSCTGTKFERYKDCRMVPQYVTAAHMLSLVDRASQIIGLGEVTL